MDVRTLSIRLSSYIKLSNMVGRSRLEPNLLPNTRAGAVEDVARFESLFTDRDTSSVCRIVHKDEPAG